jgi:RNA polymerase sporulation-specific sigma factor
MAVKSYRTLREEAPAGPATDKRAKAQLQADATTEQTGRTAAARHNLILQHIGLVHHIANRLGRVSGEPLEDLVQEGLVGLMRAVDNYSPTRGTEFSTYAYRFIEGYMLNHLRRRRRDPVALSALTRSSEENDTDLEDDADFSQQVLDRLTIAQAMSALSPLEKGVLRRFFYADLTQTEIASVLGRSRGYISRILRRALEKLRISLMEIEARQATALSDKSRSAPLVDSETGLFGRRHFDRCLEAEVARSSLDGCGFCVLMIRLDSGDMKAAAAVVRSRVRAVDQAFRFGERRLAVIVPGNGKQARAVARRIALTEMPEELPLRISYAVVEFPRDGRNVEALLRRGLRRLNPRAAAVADPSPEKCAAAPKSAAGVK